MCHLQRTAGFLLRSNTEVESVCLSGNLVAVSADFIQGFQLKGLNANAGPTFKIFMTKSFTAMCHFPSTSQLQYAQPCVGQAKIKSY